MASADKRMTSAQLNSLAEFHKQYVDLSTRNVDEDQRVKNARAAKRMVLFILLAAAFLAFYLMDKMTEALSLL
jgi:translation initiation factor 2 alpha subunit (eIF-2alpha)